MKELVFGLHISYKIMKDGEEIGSQTEEEWYNTRAEALAAAKNHPIGAVDGEYSDGAECVVDFVEIDEEPQEVDFV